MEPRTSGVTTQLVVGRIVSVLQAIERGHKTIKESSWVLHNKGGARRVSMSQGSHSCTKGYTDTWVGWEVTICVTVHDGMSGLRPNGVGGGHLR